MAEEKKQAQDDKVQVRFAEVGSSKGIVPVELAAGQTLKDLLSQQGVSADREIRVNNKIASEGTELKPDDLVMALPRVVGGA